MSTHMAGLRLRDKIGISHHPFTNHFLCRKRRTFSPCWRVFCSWNMLLLYGVHLHLPETITSKARPAPDVIKSQCPLCSLHTLHMQYGLYFNFRYKKKGINYATSFQNRKRDSSCCFFASTKLKLHLFNLLKELHYLLLRSICVQMVKAVPQQLITCSSVPCNM